MTWRQRGGESMCYYDDDQGMLRIRNWIAASFEATYTCHSGQTDVEAHETPDVARCEGNPR